MRLRHHIQILKERERERENGSDINLKIYRDLSYASLEDQKLR
jgi:hypothetical protein